jgi:hypothetical protein
MILEPKPLAEITHEAILLLCRQFGIAGALRFLNQFSLGQGNYTEERRDLFEGLTVDELVEQVKRKRVSRTPRSNLNL